MSCWSCCFCGVSCRVGFIWLSCIFGCGGLGVYFLREAFGASLVGCFGFVLFLVGYGCRVGFDCRLSM